MISWAMQYFNVNVLAWVCYIWHVGLGYMFSFAFEGKMCPMFYHGISVNIHGLYLIYNLIMIFCCLCWRQQSSLILKSDIKDSLKKFSLPFCQAEMVSVIVRFLDHVSLEHVLSVNSIWIITFTHLLHVWVTKFKTFFIFFKLFILTSNNVIWVNFSTILFDETQHVVKISTTGYEPVFMRPSISSWSLKNFCWCFTFVSSRACIWLSLPVMACWCSSCFFSMPFLVSHFTKPTALGFLDRTAISIEPSRLMKISWGIPVFLREGAQHLASRPTWGGCSVMKSPWNFVLYLLYLSTFLGQPF